MMLPPVVAIAAPTVDRRTATVDPTEAMLITVDLAAAIDPLAAPVEKRTCVVVGGGHVMSEEEEVARHAPPWTEEKASSPSIAK
jgi:hypothetical protein